MPDNSKIALFDMDGTLASYDEAMRRDLLTTLSPDEVPHIDEWLSCPEGGIPPYIKARMGMITRRVGWWKELPPLELGFQLLEMAKDVGFQIHVLTQASLLKPDAWKEKIEWCATHLAMEPVTITRNKSLVYGRILVDDYPPYVEGWLKRRPRGLAIVPARNINKGWPSADNKDTRIVKCDGSNMNEVRSRMADSFYR